MSARDDRYDPVEARRRMESALRGARIVGHKPMKDLTRGTRTLARLKKAKPMKAK